MDYIAEALGPRAWKYQVGLCRDQHEVESNIYLIMGIFLARGGAGWHESQVRLSLHYILSDCLA